MSETAHEHAMRVIAGMDELLEAKDTEIAQLRAENQRLRVELQELTNEALEAAALNEVRLESRLKAAEGALRQIADGTHSSFPVEYKDLCVAMMQIAQSALKEGEADGYL